MTGERGRADEQVRTPRKVQILTPYPVSELLSRTLCTLVEDLRVPYGESDGGKFLPFGGVVPRSPTLDVFRDTLRLAKWWDMTLEDDGEEVLADLLVIYRDPERISFDPVHAHTVELLQKMMLATLDGPLRTVRLYPSRRVYRFHYSRLYVFGNAADGGVSGFVSYLVYT